MATLSAAAGQTGWRAAVPWWTRIAAKLILSRLPLGGKAWQSLGLFSPGFMLEPDYAITVFRHHFERAGRPAAGFRFLELGPGDSLASAIVAWAHGADGGWLVDAGAYAARDLAAYQPLFRSLSARRATLNLPRDAAELSDCDNVAAMLTRTGCHYREDGLAGLRAIPNDSIDFAFSQAVLEHVPRAEFVASMIELCRALAPGAAASHQIDFKDHLGGGLNNLRFADSLWERPWFARRSGFYTNRLRLSEIVAAMTQAGFAVDIAEQRHWPVAPLPRARLAPQFRPLNDDDLRTSSALVIGRKHGR